MKITSSLVRKLRVEDLMISHSLDPIDILIENIKPSVGKAIISCGGKSWNGYWGGMGCDTVEEFFQCVSNDYLIDKMAGYYPKSPDPDKDTEFLLRYIMKERKDKNISCWVARRAFDHVRSVSPNRDTIYHGIFDARLEKSLGCVSKVWHLDWPSKPNPEYIYLSKILDVVREVLASQLDK